MIKCPYCQNELPDEALICPQCRSLLVESEKDELPRSQKKLSTWGYLSHPWAALIYLAILSSLILLGFQKPFSRLPAATPAPAPVKVTPKPQPTPQPEADLESSPAPGTEEALGEPEIQVPENRGDRRNREGGETKGSRGKRGREKRVAPDVASYEQEVKQALAQADQLVEKFNEVSRRSGKAGVSDLNDLLGEFRDLLKDLRALQPPAGFERCHTTLSNSIALTRRGLRSKLLYLETGESSQLSESQKDLDTARQQREEGLTLLENIKQDLARGKPVKPAPAPAAPAPEPAKPAEPSPKVTPPAPPPPPPPAEVAPPEPEPEPENGETLEPNVEPEDQPENVQPGPADQEEEP